MTDSPHREPPPTPGLASTEWCSIDPRNVLEYDPDTETYRASFDSDRETIYEAILAIVAAVSGTDPLELPSLQSVLDSDAVERLVESSVTGPPSSDVHVSFTFDDCDVTVHSYGIIAAQPP